jgi:hypothetical protein
LAISRENYLPVPANAENCSGAYQSLRTHEVNS